MGGMPCSIADTVEEAMETLRSGTKFFLGVLGGGIRTAQRIVLQKTRYYREEAHKERFPGLAIANRRETPLEEMMEKGLVLCGTPDMVIDQVKRAKDELGHGLMNLNMALAVNPVTNHLSVVGTEAINELRFEPNVNGIFVRSHLALINLATSPPAASISDMNNHLDYSVSTLPQSERTRSLGDPRGVAWNGAGDKIYVTGMGSNNVIVLDETGNRIGLSETIEVGEGPTGIVVSETHGQAYVLNKFSSSISVLDLSNSGSVCALQTADLGRSVGEGFEILGREEGAEARGCSIAVDLLLSEGSR